MNLIIAFALGAGIGHHFERALYVRRTPERALHLALTMLFLVAAIGYSIP